MLGLVIFLLMMATAFMGYVLPWGQMSFWAAKVITGLFGAIPLVGEPIQIWLLGGYAPDQATLTRFFSLHYLLPFVIAGVVILHIWALHIPGSCNPTGVDVKAPQDTVPFHPYYTAKDGFGARRSCLIAARDPGVLPARTILGHPDNYIPANPLSTPAHIVPEWYFWPFYAILRAFTVDFILPAKLWGVLAMFASILLLFFLPWLDKSPVRSGSYRPMFRMFFLILIARHARARLLRRPAGGGALCDDQPGRDDVLFRALPDHPADPLDGRKDAAACPIRSRRACCTARRRKPRPPISAPPRRPKRKGTTRSWFAFSASWSASASSAVAAWSLLWGVIAYVGTACRTRVEHDFHEHPRARRLLVRRPVRPLRPCAAAARLPGLSGGLRGLPRPQPGRVPQPARARLQRGRGARDRRSVADPGADR